MKPMPAKSKIIIAHVEVRDCTDAASRDIDDQGGKVRRIRSVEIDRKLVRAEKCQCGG